MNEAITEIVQEMESEVGEVGARVETLQDVQTALSWLRGSMDDYEHQKKGAQYFPEAHMQVRMLSELMRYTMRDLTEAYEKVRELQAKMWAIVIHREGESNVGE